MFWALDSDDFSGNFCGQGKYPLIKSVLSVLTGDTSIADQAKAYTDTPLDKIKQIEAKRTTKKTLKHASTDDINNYCPNGDGYYPNYNSDCVEYHVCVHTGNEEANVQFLTCPDNLKFDAKLRACNFASRVDCKPKRRVRTTKSPVANRSDRSCLRGDNLYPVEDSGCRKYYLCAFSGTEHEEAYDYECELGSLFNSHTLKCEKNFKCK